MLFTVCIYRFTHLGWREFVPILLRSADGDVEVQVLRIRDGYKARVFEEISDYDPRGFVFDRRNARVIHIGICGTP